MPSTLLKAKKPDDLATYAGLKRRIEEILAETQERIETQKVCGYWLTGWNINEHLRRKKSRSEYGSQIVKRLSRELGIDESVLWRCAQFAEKFPGLPILATWRESTGNPRGYAKLTPIIPAKKGGSKLLTWSHYRALITVSENEERESLAKRSGQYGWTVERLEQEIKKKAPPAVDSSPGEDLRLSPKRGKLRHYQIVEKRGALHLDRGFRSFKILGSGHKFPHGTIAEVQKDGSVIKNSQAAARDLYTYEAVLDRVVDGDTVWLDVLLTETDWINEKLRLRGVDAAELKTREGERAKKFVEEQLSAAGGIIITTTKTPDKWDRYLADIYLTTPGGGEVYLNQLLLDRGYAVRVQE